MKLSLFKKIGVLLAGFAAVQAQAQTELTYTHWTIMDGFALTNSKLGGYVSSLASSNYGISEITYDAEKKTLKLYDNYAFQTALTRRYTLHIFHKDDLTHYYQVSCKSSATSGWTPCKSGWSTSHLYYGYKGSDDKLGESTLLKTVAKDVPTTNFIAGYVEFDLSEIIDQLQSAGEKKLRIALAGLEYYNATLGQYDSYPLIAKHETSKFKDHVTYSNFVDIDFDATPLTTDADGCYEIASSADLYNLARQTNNKKEACAKLTNDIILNKNVLSNGALNEANKSSFTQWTPMHVGGERTFVFDGQGHSISGLYYEDDQKRQAGLFGAVHPGSKVTIKNLKLIDSFVKGDAAVGGLIGHAYGSAIIEGSQSKALVSGSNYVGGLIGLSEWLLTIDSSSNKNGVSGARYIGGLVGYFDNTDAIRASISNSYNKGVITGETSVAGIFGFVRGKVDVTHCYNSGSVTASGGGADRVSGYYAGGIIAETTDYSGNAIGMDGVYNLAIIKGSAGVGGLLGYGYATVDIKNSYNYGTRTSDTKSDGSLGGGSPNISNSFYISDSEDENGGRTADQFADGTVAAALRAEDDTWGQRIGVEKTPTFRGEISTFALGSDGCYLITDANDFFKFASIVNGAAGAYVCGKLDNDIVLNEGHVEEDGDLAITDYSEWTPIGIYGNPFNGEFDGQDHTISGLVLTGGQNVGLFGYVAGGSADKPTEIKNFTLKNSFLRGTSYTAGISAYVLKGGYVKVSNVVNKAFVRSVTDYAGSFAADVAGSLTISQCGNEGDVKAKKYAAGFVANISKDGTLSISNCYNKGDITASTSYAYGMIGSTNGSADIVNSYTSGNLSGSYKQPIGPATTLNVFYVDNNASNDQAKSETEFNNGSVAKLLKNYENEEMGIDGSIWGQNVAAGAKYPDFSGKILYSITFNVEGSEPVNMVVEAGEMPAAPSFKEDDDDYHYYSKWSPELVAAEANATYDFVSVEKVLKENALYLTVSNVTDGEHIVVETPSKCVDAFANYIWNRTDKKLEAESDTDIAGDVTFVGGKKYLITFTTTLDVTSAECLQDLYIKSVLYYGTDVKVYINDVYAGDVIPVSEGKYTTDGANKTFTATYAVKFFDEDGTLLKNVTVAPEETAEPLTVAEKTGKTFDGWYLKDDSENKFDFTTKITKNVNLYAKWALNKYAVTVSVNDSKMGTVEGAGDYEIGTEVTLVATALDGYKFSNWEDDAKAAATRKVTVTGEASYKANFEKIVVASSSSSSAKGSDVKPGSSSSEKPASSATKPGSSSSVIPGSDPESRNSSSSAKSSSSKKASSSSSKGSDVKPGSSSSVKPNSSSSVIPGSSSSVKPNSSSSVIPGSDPESRNSSSSAKRNSSSSAKKDAIVASAKVPMFSITVMGRSLQIAGAPVDAKIAVFDMQGGLVSTGRVDAANFNVAMPRSGSYMVRIGNQVQKVNVK